MNKKLPDRVKKQALVFTAHPDDHLCCAGTLMLLKDKGFVVHEIVATGGEKGTWWVSDVERKQVSDPDGLKQVRKQEITEASRVIGIDQTSFLGLPDSQIAKDHRVVEDIIGILRRERPSVVFTMDLVDYHPDHVELTKIVLEALERASWSYLPEFGDPYRVPVVLMMEGFHFGREHVTVDVTPYLERKRELLDTYGSQIFPHERRLLESMNFYRAFFRRDNQVTAAESFELPERFPIYLNKFIEVFG